MSANSLTMRQTRTSSLHQFRWIGGWLLAWTGLFYLCLWGFARIPDLGTVSSVWISGVICSLSTFGILCALINTLRSLRMMAVILISCIGANIAINQVARAVVASGGIATGHLHMGINVILLGVAVCSGVLLSYGVKKKTYIIPLALAAGMADIWSNTLGVTRQVIQSPVAMNHLLIHFPVIGRGVQPLVGITDFAFAALFMSMAGRFHLPVTKTQFVVGASFVIAITMAVVSGYGTPVLPVMGILFIVAHYRDIRVIDPREKKETLMGLFIIALALILITLLKS